MQRFFKGRTNNHLTWAMVDATDFATPESALSAATKIKIYGKLRGGTGVNFVTSGTGSLTNDIVHVGASVLGLYTIALAKADLSDASAAWYDQYIVSLSATGAAYQALVIEGVIDDSAISDLISNAYSAAVQASSRVLVVQSMASDAASAAAQANSRVLLVQSRLSDLDSRLVSDISDVLSAVNLGNSRLLVAQSYLSDIRSNVSDLQSDFQSRVPKAVATNSQLSDLASDLKSYLAVMSGVQSDIYSALSDFQSDFQSRVPKAVATASNLSDVESNLLSLLGTTGVQLNASSLSDLRSAITAITVTVGASDISDIASAVRAALVSDLSDILSAAQQTNSRVLVGQSYLSDIRSQVTAGVPLDASTMSDLRSAVNAVTINLTASDISDIASAVAAAVTTITASDISDIASAVKAALASDISDILSAAQQTNSRVLVTQSHASNIYSLLSDVQSDFQSRVPKRVATDSQLSALTSDVLSALAAGVPVSASDMSDIRSAIAAGTLTASAISDIASAVAVEIASNLSDILSAARQTSSRVLVNQSNISDIYSLLSDLHSDVGVLSGVTSDVYSAVTAGVEIGASSLSDLRSAITANGVLRTGTEPTTVIGHTGTLAAKVDWLTALSRNKVVQTTGVQSLRNDADSADIASAAVADDGASFVRGEFA